MCWQDAFQLHVADKKKKKKCIYTESKPKNRRTASWTVGGMDYTVCLHSKIQ
jgi:hypothetical protein